MWHIPYILHLILAVQRRCVGSCVIRTISGLVFEHVTAEPLAPGMGRGHGSSRFRVSLGMVQRELL